MVWREGGGDGDGVGLRVWEAEVGGGLYCCRGRGCGIIMNGVGAGRAAEGVRRDSMVAGGKICDEKNETLWVEIRKVSGEKGVAFSASIF